MPYIVKTVSLPQMEEPTDQYPSRGGFGLEEDDIIYQGVHRTLQQDNSLEEEEDFSEDE